MTTIEKVKATWKEEAANARFFGKPVSELRRDDLLAVIGCLIHTNRYEAKGRESYLKLLAALQKQRRAKT